MTDKMTYKRASELLAMIEVDEPDAFIVHSWWGSFVQDYREALQIAIEALKQELCEDCISRQAVKDIICSGVSIDTDADKEYVYELIDKLPSVTPKGKTGWIPVTKRVPQECIHTYDNNFHNYTRSEFVLVTIRNKVTNSVYVFHDLAYISNGEWYIDSRYDHEQFKNCSVIAWMPLPEPMKEGD